MDRLKITGAVDRLEQNLPLRLNQLRLPETLRGLHQSILRHFLEVGVAPGERDIDYPGDWAAAISRLTAEKIIVVNQFGKITGAYPFVDEDREFRVVSKHGAVNAMCAFDALAVSSMFDLPTRIESCCRVTGRRILIDQQGDSMQLVEPDTAVFAVIDWNAWDSASSCSTTLCTEMFFIAGDENALSWLNENPADREVFGLLEAHAFITAVFLPLMHRDRPGSNQP